MLRRVRRNWRRNFVGFHKIHAGVVTTKNWKQLKALAIIQRACHQVPLISVGVRWVVKNFCADLCHGTACLVVGLIRCIMMEILILINATVQPFAVSLGIIMKLIILMVME
jgi:hypothetical protein